MGHSYECSLHMEAIALMITALAMCAQFDVTSKSMPCTAMCAASVAAFAGILSEGPLRDQSSALQALSAKARAGAIALPKMNWSVLDAVRKSACIESCGAVSKAGSKAQPPRPVVTG